MGLDFADFNFLIEDLPNYEFDKRYFIFINMSSVISLSRNGFVCMINCSYQSGSCIPWVRATLIYKTHAIPETLHLNTNTFII